MGQKPSYAELEKLVADLSSENTGLRKSLSPSSSTIPGSGQSHSPSFQHSTMATPVVELQKIIDSIPQAIFWKNRTSHYLGCNRLFAEIAGLKSPSQVIGLSDYDLPWKIDEADFFRQCDKRVMDNNLAEYNIVEPQQTAKGEQTWLNTNKIPLHDSSGNVVGILGTYEDITNRIQAEEVLRNYETITATIDDLVAIVDRNHVYTAVNEAYQLAYGIKKEVIIGTSIDKLIGTRNYEEIVKDKVNQALKGETVFYEKWCSYPEWGERYQHITYFPLFDEQTKEVLGVVSKLRDMTQQKKLETLLQHAQKMEAIGRLGGGIAHDFNNILSVINGYSELSLMQLEENHPCIPFIEMIAESSLRGARLTEQLLAFSRKQIIQPERMNLIEELSSINLMLTRLLGENIAIELSKTESVWDVKLDRSQLEQVLMNLAVNARDAMAEGGRLSIEITNISKQKKSATDHCIEEPGDYVMLAITDTGTGMDPEVQLMIFEPFYTTKENSKGTGLGLSTVYGIVKQNDGYISVDSEVEKGTTFKLYFPRCTEGIKSCANKQEEEQKSILETGKETILLVEDDYALRQICLEILNNLGYNVLETSNGEEAIEMFGQFQGKIDLLLTDVIMPVLSGPETAKILSDKDPSLVVLYMSGYTENAIFDHEVQNEKVHFLQKPISSKSLAKAVHKALNQ